MLETRPGAIRVWDSSVRAADLTLAEERLGRSAVAAEGGHFLAGEDLATGDLFFLFKDGSGQIDLPVPPRAGASARARPVLLTHNDRLDGAVWLDGSAERGYAVVGSAWNGTSWEATETIAPANGRPQLAPAAVALADGSWLAVWAGFDGEDDEIFWSRRQDGIWSAPKRVHRDNRVPDLLPALTSVGDGDGDDVLAAWSFYDGNDYRILTARFNVEAGRWRISEPLAGLGAGYTHWQKSGGRAFVTYRSVVPEGWTAVELGLGGEILHRVTIETGDERPPVVQATSGFGPPRLVWPYRPGRPRR